MAVSRDAIVAEARSWLGTPFRHQGRAKGVGVDCIGLVLGVGLALGLIDLEGRTPDELRRLSAYRRSPNGYQLRRGCDDVLTRLPPQAWSDGDVLLFAGRALPQHMGIVSTLDAAPALIHCHGDVGRCVEHRLDATWRGRVVQGYGFRGVG